MAYQNSWDSVTAIGKTSPKHYPEKIQKLKNDDKAQQKIKAERFLAFTFII